MLERQCFIPEPEEFIAEQPMSATLIQIKKSRDEEIRKVLSGATDKMLVVVGPCSAHEPAPTIEYISRLGKLNDKVKDKLVIVPRIYTNKPRTKGVGYKQPELSFQNANMIMFPLFKTLQCFQLIPG